MKTCFLPSLLDFCLGHWRTSRASRSLILPLAFAFLLFWPAIPVFANTAQEVAPEQQTNTTLRINCEDASNPQTCEGFRFFNDALNLLASVVVSICVLLVIIAGIQYSIAREKPELALAAQMRIYKAMLALVLFVFMWAFLKWLIPGENLE